MSKYLDILFKKAYYNRQTLLKGGEESMFYQINGMVVSQKEYIEYKKSLRDGSGK